VKREKLTVAVTGLNATDNPAPGVGVLRSLRHESARGDYRLVGLAYDALDPGVYASDVVDEVFLIPYPSQGRDALLDRLAYIHERVGLDVVLPTLDAELPAFIESGAELRAMGIGTFLPTREQLDARAKANLAELGRKAGLPVPDEVVLGGPDDLLRVHEKVPYPFFVKGPYYGATLARGLDEATAAYHQAIAQWGPPILVQKLVDGEELNLVALGDGAGGLVGAVAMKKLVLTDKGKGWAGITIFDPELVALAERFMKATRWRGGLELEVMRDRKGGLQLLEINPRFPAWVHLSSAAGQNLPEAAVRLAAGRKVTPRRDYAVGTLFVRIALDQIVSLGDFQSIVTGAELIRELRLERKGA
jgi:carbamoyl-phosphate synthase large subunit